MTWRHYIPGHILKAYTKYNGSKLKSEWHSNGTQADQLLIVTEG